MDRPVSKVLPLDLDPVVDLYLRPAGNSLIDLIRPLLVLACPLDTNGDGDCGKPFCPYCGKGTALWDRAANCWRYYSGCTGHG